MIQPKHSKTKVLPLPRSQNKMAFYMREYRKNHPESVARQRLRKREIRLKLLDMLGERKCVRCGYSTDLRALHIGHKNGGAYLQRRTQTMDQMYRFYLRSPDVAKADLEVICANCNSIQQADQREYSWLRNSEVKKA